MPATDAAAPVAVAQPTVPAIKVPVAAWAAAFVAMVALYLVLQENGVVVQQGWHTIHELFHDARHALGVPCH